MEKKIDFIKFVDGTDLLVGYIDVRYGDEEIIYTTKMTEDSEERITAVSKSQIRYLEQRGTIGKKEH